MTDFIGGDGDDIFVGSENGDNASGGGGSDTLNGNGGNDHLAGEAGSDTIDGGSGDDFLYSGFRTTLYDTGTELDTLYGGDGNDWIYAGYGDTVDGGNGIQDRLFISLMGAVAGVTVDFNQPGIMIGGGAITGIECVALVQGSNFDDDITMRSQNALTASASVYGMGGNDRLIASLGTVSMFGGDGNDFVDGRGSDSLEVVDGGAGDDVLYHQNNNLNTAAIARGGDGDDIIYASCSVFGDAGNDTIYVTDFGGWDIRGGTGNDIIYVISNQALTPVYGDEGDDTLIGSDEADILVGGAGSDVIDGGALYVPGQTDNDTAVYTGNAVDYSVVSNPGTGVVTITDLRPGSPDGTDTLLNIDKVQFADRTFTIEALLSGYADLSGNFSGTIMDDIFHGSEAGEFVLGYLGDDILYGYGGDDLLLGEDGGDYLHGGAGDDVLYSSVSITDDESVYDWSVYSRNLRARYSLDVGTEADTLNGGIGDDELHAGYGDTIDGGTGIDTLFLNFRGASSGVTVDFRSNTNVVGVGTITNVEFIATLLGSNFDDDITLGTNTPPNASNAYAAGGIVHGRAGNDRLVAGNFTDALFGDDGNDVIDGSGSNTLRRVDGGDGDDRIMIAAVANTTDVIGGAGFDTFSVSGAVSVGGSLSGIEALDLIGGANLTLTGTQFATGLATNTAISGTGTVTVNMSAGVIFAATGLSFAGGGVALIVNGTSGTDIIKLGLGTTSNTTINGGDGVDQIRGGQGIDTINGDGGNDKIMGLGGADLLTGGAGNDQFRYFSAMDSGAGANADRITDFNIGGDRLNFALIDADATTTGDQAFAFIGTGAFAASGVGQIRFANSGADIVVQADVNGDGVVDMEIILQGLNGQTLTGADFIL